MASAPREGPHAPALDWSHRAFGRFHVTGVFWYQFPEWCVARAPLWMHGPAIVLFCAFFFVMLGRIRGAIAANLEPALGPAGRIERWRRAWRTMVEFARCLSERYSRLAGRPRGPTVPQGLEYWQPIRESGQGAVVVTAHIGPWESAALEGVTDLRRTIHVVREAEIDPRAQEFVRGLLRRAGEHYVPHFAGEDDRLVFELVEALRRGEVVALQGDRPRATGRHVCVPFFGRPMPLPIGAPVLARAADVPMVPVFSFLDDDYTLRTVVRAPIAVPRTANREADVSAALGQLATELEWAVRHRPFQWFCFRRLWP